MNYIVIDKIPADYEGWNYPAQRKPLRPLALKKLPIKSIKPKGWLLDQLELMSEGMTGRLYEYSVEHLQPENGWLTPENTGTSFRQKPHINTNVSLAPGERYVNIVDSQNYNDIAWEEQPYWFRGFYDLGVILENGRIGEVSEKYIKAMFDSADEDGWFGPKCLKNPYPDKPRNIPDLWPHMIMFDALRSYYEATGDERTITLIDNFFRYCLSCGKENIAPDLSGENYCWTLTIQNARAGDMIPHIYWLYNITGEEYLLDLADLFYEKCYKDPEHTPSMHGVNFAQMFCYGGLRYEKSNDPEDLAMTERWRNDFFGEYGQVPGGGYAADETAREGKTDPRQGTESCTFVELDKSYLLLSEITGEPKYADYGEEVMLNSFTAAYTDDMKQLHYITAPNQPEMDEQPRDYFNCGAYGGIYVEYTKTSPSCRCCIYNTSMGWPYYSEHLIMAAGSGIASWYYAACEADVLVGNDIRAHISEETDYPFDTTVKFRIDCEDKAEFPFYIRIPEWADGVILSVNSEETNIDGSEGKIVVLNRLWANDVVEVTFKQKIILHRWARNGDSLSIQRGPLSYSLYIREKYEEHPEKEYFTTSVMPETPWNYAIDIDSVRLGSVKKPVGQPWNAENAPITLFAKAKRIDSWKIGDDHTVEPVPQSPVESFNKEETVKLIPMGCARLRISCFPVLK